MRPLKFNLYVFVKTFAASAGISAGATNGDFFKLAVATLIVVFANADVTRDIAIEIFHFKSSDLIVCENQAFIQSY